MEVEPEFWQNPDALKNIYVRSPTGGAGAARARSRATSRRTAPLAVNHQGQFPAVTLSFNLAPGVALGEAVDARSSDAEREIGMPATIHGSFQGTAQAFQASLAQPAAADPRRAGHASTSCSACSTRATIHPITILSTLPSAGVGALLALLLCRTELT